MHPFKHGKAFMLGDDGGEVDLDLGNCERFLDIKLTRDSNGKIFQSLIDKGRKVEYLGKTLQIVPHITNAIQDGIEPVAIIPVDGMDRPADVCVIELGGTIGGHEFNTEDLSAPLLNGRHQSLIRLHLRNEKESRFPLSKGSLSAQPPQARKVLPCLPLCFVLPHACATVLHRALRGLCTTEAPSKAPHEPMSPSELDTISMLIPRLISEGHVSAAGRLLSAALLPGSTDRLPFSPLAEHLASLPTLFPAFALLTALCHHPVGPSALPLATPLLDNLLSMRRARHAASVLRWLCRPDSSSRPDDNTYDIAVAGFCRIEDPKSALVALREMAVDGVRPSQKLQEAVQDAMLQDARIEEAWALEETMRLPESRKTVELVDKFLGAWED